MRTLKEGIFLAPLELTVHEIKSPNGKKDDKAKNLPYKNVKKSFCLIYVQTLHPVLALP